MSKPDLKALTASLLNGGFNLVALQDITEGRTNISNKRMQELAEAEVPYFVSSDDLRSVGVDPAIYLKVLPTVRGAMCGCMLDRKKDAVLIERLQSLQEPHEKKQ
jgi:hypothetical protein